MKQLLTLHSRQILRFENDKLGHKTKKGTDFSVPLLSTLCQLLADFGERTQIFKQCPGVQWLLEPFVGLNAVLFIST